ncbi:hypothetical protein BH11BAC2_BH11BAC2_15910 [soil metagenome]
MFRLRKISAIFLLALSLQWVVPRELWHELCEHTDSVDCQTTDNTTSVSIQHEHCLVLELSLPPMWQEAQHFNFIADADAASHFVNRDITPPAIIALVSGNRGPPSII